jgi:hypothetical protein
MQRRFWTTAAMLAFAGVIVPRVLTVQAQMLSGAADEKPLKMQDLPIAVQQAVKAQSKIGTLQGLSTEVEDGRKVYEAEFKASGRSTDVIFDAQGKILSTEAETDLATIPAPAKAAIQKAAGGGRTLLVETVQEGNATSHEAQLDKGGRKSEVKMNDAGKVVK